MSGPRCQARSSSGPHVRCTEPAGHSKLEAGGSTFDHGNRGTATFWNTTATPAVTVELGHVPGLYGCTKLVGADGRPLVTLTTTTGGGIIAESPLPYLSLEPVHGDNPDTNQQIAVRRAADAVAALLSATFGVTAVVTVTDLR